ncbi:MAG: kelch repeat-containing protein [Bacteroidota bacterium]
MPTDYLPHPDTYLRQIAQELRAAGTPALNVHRVHPGHLNPAEQHRLLALGPCLLLSVSGADDATTVAEGVRQQRLQILALLLDEGALGPDPEREVRRRALELQRQLLDPPWKHLFPHLPGGIRSQNLFPLLAHTSMPPGSGWPPTLVARARCLVDALTASPDRKRALWALTWTQKVNYPAESPELIAMDVEHLNHRDPAPPPDALLPHHDVTLPDVQELRLDERRFRPARHARRQLHGTVSLRPPDPNPAIHRYDVFWADRAGKRIRKEALLRFPPEGPYAAPLPAGTVVPRGAEALMAVARSPRGVSPNPAVISLADYWKAGPAPSRTGGTPIAVSLGEYPLLLQDVGADGQLRAERYRPATQTWEAHNLPDCAFTTLLGAGTTPERLWVAGKTATALYLQAYPPSGTPLRETFTLPLPPDFQPVSVAIGGHRAYCLGAGAAGTLDALLTCELRPGHPDFGTWRSSRDPNPGHLTPGGPPAGRRDVAVAWAGERLWMLGGQDNQHPHSAATWAYDPLGATWRRGPTLPLALRGATCLPGPRGMYLLGGSTENGPSGRLFYGDYLSETWQELAALPQIDNLAAAFWAGGEIHVVDAGVSAPTTHIYVPPLNH